MDRLTAYFAHRNLIAVIPSTPGGCSSLSGSIRHPEGEIQLVAYVECPALRSGSRYCDHSGLRGKAPVP